MERHPERRALERHRGADARVRDPGHGAQSLEQLPIEGCDSLPRIQLLLCHRQRERQCVVRLHAQIDLRTIPEAVNRQAGTRERRDRQRELGDHKALAQPATAAADRCATAVSERLVDIDAACLPCGRRSEQERAGGRCDDREQEDRYAQARVGLGG